MEEFIEKFWDKIILLLVGLSYIIKFHLKQKNKIKIARFNVYNQRKIEIFENYIKLISESPYYIISEFLIHKNISIEKRLEDCSVFLKKLSNKTSLLCLYTPKNVRILLIEIEQEFTNIQTNFNDALSDNKMDEFLKGNLTIDSIKKIKKCKSKLYVHFNENHRLK